MWHSVTSWLTPSSLFLLLNFMIGTIVVTSRFSKRTHNQSDGEYRGLERAPSLLGRVKSINFSLYKFNAPATETDFVQAAEPQHVYAQSAPPQLYRAPSLLDRVKSINFSSFNFPAYTPEADFSQAQESYYATPQPEPPQLQRAPSLLQRVKSIDFTSLYRSDAGKMKPETEFPADAEVDSDANPDLGQVKRSKSERQARQRKGREEMKKSASENSRAREQEEDEEEVGRRRPATMRVERTVSIGDDHSVDAKADDFINKFKQQLKLQRLDSLLRNKELLKAK